jgi:2'-5' RNA ligase
MPVIKDSLGDYMESWADWQKVYEHGTFLIVPPDDVRAVVNKLRERYDPVSQKYCEAHVTLTQPLLKRLTEDDWNRLKSISSGFGPFEIKYGPLNTFLPYPCIYYEIQPVETILEIRNTIHETGLCNLNLPHTEGFIPHMTITEAYFDSGETKRIFDTLRNEISGGTFKCSEITFLKPDVNFHFEVQRILKLGQT